MKARFLAAVLIAAAPVAFTACDNKQESKEGAVYIQSTWTELCPEWDVQPGSAHVTISEMSFVSQVKTPGGATHYNDVELTDMWVFFKRLDGGRVVPSPYHQRYHVMVPAGGDGDLTNARILPPEDLLLPPFDSLWPENGGVDLDTGRAVIEMGAVVRWYGKTYSGEEVSTEFTVPLEFRYGFGCNSPGSAAR